MAENTLVVFAADHGLAVGQHGLIGKQNLYEHSTRAPLIFRGPGVPKGERRETLVYLHSIFPTVCEWVGLPVPERIDARGLKAATVDPKEVRCARSWARAMWTCNAWRPTDVWKLILYPKVSLLQLFDLQADPWERNNLAGDAEHAKTIQRLLEGLKAWAKEVEDPLKYPADLTDYQPAPNRL